MLRHQDQERPSTEELIQRGINGMRNGEYSSAYSAAKALGISKTTLSERFKGRLSKREAHVSQQVLSDSEEKALAKWITRLTLTGLPPSYVTIRRMVETIRTDRAMKINDASIELVSYTPLGKHWVERFLNRHLHLKAVHACRIDACHIDQSTKEAVETWFDALRKIFNEEEIELGNVYNMDESGFNIGVIQVGCRVMDSRCNINYSKQPGRHEWVTVLECICVDGTAISPLVIFKAEKLISNCIPSSNLIQNWHFAPSNKGWTNNPIGLEWLQYGFEPTTHEKAAGKPCVLILDGHRSHCTDPFLAHAYLNNIIVMRLPPHTSHLLQPLDVGLFGPLKTYAVVE